MPKIRGIKPEFWTDEDVCELSAFARLLYIGLWNFACDNGHLQDKPKQIKRRVLPDDDVNCAELLREIEEQGLIERINGWIIIPKLSHHQKPHKRWWSTCEMPGCTRPDGDSPAQDNGGPQVDNGGATVTNHRSTADGDGDGDGDLSTSPPPSPAASSTDVEREFDDWWKHYPRKVGKGQARKAYRAARKKTTPETLTSALAAQRSILLARGERFCPHAATWLNGERWDDQQSQHLALVENDPASLPPVEETWMRRRPQ